MSNYISIPKWIFLQITDACNLRCKFCYEWGSKGYYSKTENNSYLNIEKIKEIILQCSANKPYYDLFGGEPLIYPDLFQLLRSIKDAGSSSSIPSNGINLIDKSNELIEAEADLIWISLEGPRDINDALRGKGVYDKVKNGILHLAGLKNKSRKKYPKIGISTVITPFNYHTIDKLYSDEELFKNISHVSIEMQQFITQKELDVYKKFIKNEFNENSIKYVSGYLVKESIFNEMDYDLLSLKIKGIAQKCNDKNMYFNSNPKSTNPLDLKYYFSSNWSKISDIKKKCLFPWLAAEINASGNVTPCHTFYDLTFGNIYETSFLEIWNCEKIKKYRSYLKHNLLSICTACCLFYNKKPDNNYS